MRDDEKFEIIRALDLLPHIAGASWAMLWFRINEVKNPTKEEFREKTVEYFSKIQPLLKSFDNKIDNDSSLKTLAKIAVSQAKAGVDVVSPSAMMDGQVKAIRKALDDEGFTDVAIMSHSAKHRSNFYSPFRDAAECAPQFSDRRTYQVPFTNPREAMREVEADIDEGVDIVMIKPALTYLDLISETRKRFNIPVAAYSVSGEYALVKGAAMQGWIDEEEMTKEILYSIKRAGADMIVTYFAKHIAEKL